MFYKRDLMSVSYKLNYILLFNTATAVIITAWNVRVTIYRYIVLQVKKDYSAFFAKHALSHNYPGYRVPPGTQHYEDFSGRSSY